MEGKKTFLLCAGGIVYAALGLFLHQMSVSEAAAIMWAALTGASLRNAIK